MPADGVLGQQLDDRLGDVGGVGRRPPLVADDAERLAGRRGPLRGVEDPAREVAARAPRTARPSGRSRGSRPGRPSKAPRREPLALQPSRRRTGCPARPGRRARSRGRRSASRRRPRWSRRRARSMPRAAQASARTPVATPLRRSASSGSRAQPSTSVQAAAWTTTSGRSRSSRAPIAVGRVEVERVARPGDRPGRAGERRVGEGGDERAPEAPAGPGDGDAHQSRRRGRRRRGAAWPVASRPPYWRSY